MLLRAASRSLRTGIPVLRQAHPPAFSATQWRSYAKSNKLKKADSYNPPSHSLNAARSTPSTTSPAPSPRDGEVSSQSSDGSGRPDYSSTQEEFRTSAASEQNTAPQNTSPAAIDPAEAKAQDEQTQFPLHDLTRGIPSTLDAELEASSRKGRTELEESNEQASTGGKGNRRMPASAYETSADRRKNQVFFWMLTGMAASVLGGVIYFGRNWATEEEERSHPNAPSGWGVGLFYNRLRARMTSTMDYYNEPAFPKLLPDPDPAWERPYTLVLSLEDLLIHSEWTREHGWRMAKRPGVDYFLRYLSQYYELVIFTSLPSMTGHPIVQKLDPYRIVMWPLFREATSYKNGKYVKDLTYLNRDLSKVIIIDTDPTHASLQPENAVILPKWKGSPGDTNLVALIPFLEYVAALGLDDTRKVLSSFSGKDIPTEFGARESQARQRFNAQLAEERAKRPRHSGVGFLGSALGIKSGAGMETMDGLPTLTEGFEQGKMLHDQIRERGQKQYEMIEREIRENGEKWLKEMAAEEEKARDEAMKGMRQGLTGWFGTGAGKGAAAAAAVRKEGEAT